MIDDADVQCRWLVAFVCSPDWTTAATRAVEAHAHLVEQTERHFGRRHRPIPPTILTPPSSREQCRRTMIVFATDMLATGHRWSGELAIAWRMLACDPSKLESFNVVLPPLTRLLDDSFASESADGVVLAAAPMLLGWSIGITRVPSGHEMYLTGKAVRHPVYPDGKHITTSAVVWLDPQHRWARTRSRVYVLDNAGAT